MDFFSSIIYLYLAGNMYVFFRGWKSVPGLSLSVKLLVEVVYWLVVALWGLPFRIVPDSEIVLFDLTFQ